MLRKSKPFGDQAVQSQLPVYSGVFSSRGQPDSEHPSLTDPENLPRGVSDFQLWRHVIQPIGYFERIRNLSAVSSAPVPNTRDDRIGDTLLKTEESATVQKHGVSAEKEKQAKERLRRKEKEKNILESQAHDLLVAGLNAESNNKPSKFALCQTPQIFLGHEAQVEFRPHQKHAVGKLNQILNRVDIKPNTAILNYDMGLGKTYILHALMHLNNGKGRGPMVLIIPHTLLGQWKREVETKAVPALRYCVYDTEHVTALDMMTYEIVITTFKQVRMDWNARKQAMSNMEKSCKGDNAMAAIRTRFPLYLISWSYMFVDEVQIITNQEAGVTQAVCSLRCDRRVGATGTVLQNDYHNLQAVAIFLKLEPWNDREYFNKCFVKRKGRNKAQRLTGMRNDFLAMSLRANILRLLASDKFDDKNVIDFPEAHYETLKVTLNAEEQRVQDELRLYWDPGYRRAQKRLARQEKPHDSGLDIDELLPALGRGRQATVHHRLYDTKYTAKGPKSKPKLTARTKHDMDAHALLLAELEAAGYSRPEDVEDLRPSKVDADKMLKDDIRNDVFSSRIETLLGHLRRRLRTNNGKILIFDESKRVLDVVSIALEAAKLAFYYIHGDIPREHRDNDIAAFASLENNVKIFLLTAGCGGLGIDNLVVADTVYIMTPMQNPFLERQCIARAVRKGNPFQVHIYRFYTHNSMERRVNWLKNDKEEKATNLFDTRNVSSANEQELSSWVDAGVFSDKLSTLVSEVEKHQDETGREKRSSRGSQAEDLLNDDYDSLDSYDHDASDLDDTNEDDMNIRPDAEFVLYPRAPALNESRKNYDGNGEEGADAMSSMEELAPTDDNANDDTDVEDQDMYLKSEPVSDNEG